MAGKTVGEQVRAFAEAGGKIYSLAGAAQEEMRGLLGEYRPTASKRRLHVLRLPRLEREMAAQPGKHAYWVAVLDGEVASVMIHSVWDLASDIFLVQPPDEVHLDALASFREGTGAGSAMLAVLAQRGLRIKLFSLAQSASFYERLGALGSRPYRRRLHVGRDFIFLEKSLEALGDAARPWFEGEPPVLESLEGLSIPGRPRPRRAVAASSREAEEESPAC